MNAPEMVVPFDRLKGPLSQAKRPLKIALLGYRSHPYVGGQGIYLKYLSRALARLGHQVHVFSGPPYPALDDHITLTQIPSLNLFEAKNHTTALRPKHLKSFTDFYEWWTMLTGGFAEPYTFGRRLIKFFHEELRTFDIIHDNQSLCYSLLKLESADHNVVATVHHPITRDRDLALAEAPNWQYRCLIKRWYSFLTMQKKVVQRLNNIITVSATSQRDIKEHFDRDITRTTVIPNGIDTALFSPQASIDKEPFQLITTASSDQPLKGLKYLLQALEQLSEDFPQLQLTVIGKLNPEGTTQKHLEESGIIDRVEFVSGISDQELVAQYSRASIAVCPSLYEGFGLPAGEAMSCGLAVVSTDGGALPEVIGDAGIVVPAGSSSELAKAIRQLLEAPGFANALGQRARERILKTFCWNKVAEDLTTYYHSLLGEKDANR